MSVMKPMKTLTILGNTYEIVDQEARDLIAKVPSSISTTSVSYEAQTLTESQKTQARTNINASSLEEVDTKINAANSVLFDSIFDTIPKATNAAIVQSENKITVTTTLTDGDTSVSVISMDENGYPITIDTDGIIMNLTWSTATDETEVTSNE